MKQTILILILLTQTLFSYGQFTLPSKYSLIRTVIINVGYNHTGTDYDVVDEDDKLLGTLSYRDGPYDSIPNTYTLKETNSQETIAQAILITIKDTMFLEIITLDYKCTVKYYKNHMFIYDNYNKLDFRQAIPDKCSFSGYKAVKPIYNWIITNSKNIFDPIVCLFIGPFITESIFNED